MEALAFDAPQIIYTVLAAMGLGVAIVKHGESRGNYSFWTILFNTMLSVGLLYWGGFFTA